MTPPRHCTIESSRRHASHGPVVTGHLMEAKPVLALSAALVVGAAVGYVAATRDNAPTRPANHAVANGSEAAMPTAPSPKAQGPAPNPGDTPATSPSGDWAADLHAAVALSPATARADRIRELAAAAPLADIVRILEVAHAVLPAEHFGVFGERLLQRLAATEPLKAMAIAGREGRDGHHNFEHEWRGAILEVWLESDAPAAVRWFQSLPPGNARDRAQYVFATTIARRAPAHGVALVRSLASAGERHEFANEFFYEWAQSDPRAALNAANEFFKLPKDAGELGRLIGSWAKRDAAAATAHLRSLGDGPAQARLARSVLSSLAESSPALAAELLPRFPKALRHPETVSAIVSQWASRDLPAALRWAEGMDNPETRRIALAAAIEWASNEDPKAALDLYQRHQNDPALAGQLALAAAGSFASDPQAGLRWIESLPSMAARDVAFTGLFNAWAKQDPKGAAQHAATLPPGQARNASLGTVANALASADPDALLPWLKSLASPKERLDVGRQIAWQLASNHPEQGIAILDSLPNGAARAQSMAQFAEAWSQNDLDGAVSWMKTLKDAAAQKSILGGILSPWTESDPAAAAAHLASLPASQVPNDAWSTLASQWAPKDPKAALAWAKALPEGNASQQAIQAVVGSWANQAPADAFQFAQSLPSPEARSESIKAAFQAWAGNNPAEAAAALDKLPDPAQRSEVTSEVISRWAGQDPVAAAQWLAAQPDSSRTDEVLSSLASQLVQYEPQTAVQWAASIKDADTRNGMIVQSAQQWLESNPDEANAWLKTSGLDESLVQQIHGNGDQGDTPRFPLKINPALRRRYGL